MSVQAEEQLVIVYMQTKTESTWNALVWMRTVDFALDVPSLWPTWDWK